MCYSLIIYMREFAFNQLKTTDKTRSNMEKMEGDDVIVFSFATLTLVCAVDMLYVKKNQEIKKLG